MAAMDLIGVVTSSDLRKNMEWVLVADMYAVIFPRASAHTVAAYRR